MFKTISFNLEYQDIEYDKTKIEKVGPFSPADSFSDTQLKNKGYVMSVSFPFTL